MRINDKMRKLGHRGDLLPSSWDRYKRKFKDEHQRVNKDFSNFDCSKAAQARLCVDANSLCYHNSVPNESKCNNNKSDISLMRILNQISIKFKATSIETNAILRRIKGNKLIPKSSRKKKGNYRVSLDYERINQSISQTACKLLSIVFILLIINYVNAETQNPNQTPTTSDAISQSASSSSGTTCFGGLQTFEKISMSTFENPSSSSGASSSSFGGGILVQQDDQALTSECVNLCRSQSNCLSFVIDYDKFECKSYATTQQELQQEFDTRYQTARSINSTISINGSDASGYQSSASTVHFQHLLPSASSNYFEKICLDGVANRNQFNDVCGQGRLWTIERVVDSFLDGFIEKEVTNVNNKDECGKLCIFEAQFVCRSADYDHQSRLCRLSKEDRRTQPQAMRYVPGSNRHYLENQCATPGPSSCVYETKKNTGIISMDALKFAQTVQDCQMKCNQESTFNCRSYSFYQQRCFLSGDDSSSLNSNLIKLPTKQGWLFGEKKCLVELCTKGIFSYEKITGYTLRSALSSPIDLMTAGSSHIRMAVVGTNLDELEKLQHESSQTRLQHFLPMYYSKTAMNSSNLATMMMMAANNNQHLDPMDQSASSIRNQRSSSNNLAITNHCRHSCDLGYLNCPAFTIDYKNNRCQRLDRNSQGRHHELVAKDGFAYYEKICLRVPEIMSMCQDKYWIFERAIGYELAPRLYEKSLKFVQSRRDCEEYCLEEKQFQCRSALYNDEISECKLSRYDRRLITQEGGYYRNFNARISYLENQCIRDHGIERECTYEQAKDEPSYPTFTEHIEMVPTSPKQAETESVRQTLGSNSSRHGAGYCEQLCNDNAKFECHSFGYYVSTAQCFLSGDDSTSAGESATTPSTGFTYYEKKCRMSTGVESPTNYTMTDEPPRRQIVTPPSTTSTTSGQPNLNPYFPVSPNNNNHHHLSNTSDGNNMMDMPKPHVQNNNISIHIDQRLNFANQRPQKQRPQMDMNNETGSQDADQYKCGVGHTFVYQRISGFEPIGGYLTLLVKNNDQPGIVNECSEQCKRAYECRAFVVDYNSNQCFAMLENSSVGLLSLRQTLGKDYFEGFCIANHILLPGNNCKNKTWVVDKIVDQAVIGVQHQKVIADSDRAQCRQACLDERLFWCKSAMFDEASGDCKLYSVDRESMAQMRLLFTKGVDFFENQCQIMSSSCPYDAIERDMTIVTTTKSVQARSTFDCELACNEETSFNCRSYTYLDQYPSLPNLCLLSSDSRSTSQKGSVRERQRTLYAERNCYYRRPRYPNSMSQKPPPEPMYSPPAQPAVNYANDPYQSRGRPAPTESYQPPRLTETLGSPNVLGETELASGCEQHQFTFERTFGYDYRLAQKERAPVPPTIGIAIGCQQECLRRGERCLSFVVEYALPYQGCFLMETQVGANKKLLVKTPNSAYFEKVCLPRIGLDTEQLTHVPILGNNGPADMQSMDIAPSYSQEPWAPQAPNQLPYYLQQQQLVQNYPSRSCAKLWSFERFINHNFTAASDKTLENTLTRAQCETHCINEASFTCRAATYDYSNKLCRLFKNTRRTIMSQFIDLESAASGTNHEQMTIVSTGTQSPGTAQVLNEEKEQMQSAPSSSNILALESKRRHQGARQLTATSQTAEASMPANNIDYMENTCVPEPSSCQYRQLYDVFSLYIDKINHAVSLSDCQRQCDLERLFSCKSINYDPNSRNCMLINEDLISLTRGQQSSLLPKKNTIYSEKGNCEMISVQCNSQEMLLSMNFDSPFRGRVMAKGNPEQCYLIGDGQTSLQFPIVFGPKCNSRQEGHNTFVNEVVIQQHPVIMTDSDKTVRVMCAFEAPDQMITLKNPSSRDNKTGIDVGTPESSRTRHDKQHFNPVVSNKAAPPSVLLRILDQNGRDASMINLGDDLVLKIQMQVDGQNSALGIFARNLAAKSSSGESLLLIDNDGCPVDHLVFPALEVDPKDGKSLYSTFKAFRFPSSGLVNFEVQIRFCPERCQPVDCNRGHKMRSYGRRKREVFQDTPLIAARTPILQSVQKNPIEELSTVMKPGKAFQFVRELLFKPQVEDTTATTTITYPAVNKDEEETDMNTQAPANPDSHDQILTVPESTPPDLVNEGDSKIEPEVTTQTVPQQAPNDFMLDKSTETVGSSPKQTQSTSAEESAVVQQPYQKSILLHVDEKVVPSTSYGNPRGLNQPHSSAPYGRYPIPDIELHHKRQSFSPELNIPTTMSQHENGQLPTRVSHSDNEYPSNTGSAFMNTNSEQQPNQNQAGLNLEPEQTTSGSSGTQSIPNEETVNQFKANEDESRVKQDNSQRDVPLRFSILVGENQAMNQGGWAPSSQAPVLVMNSNSTTSVDHIVVPGKYGQFEHISNGGSNNQAEVNSIKTLNSPSGPSDTIQQSTFAANSKSNAGFINPELDKKNQLYEQNLDTLSSNSVEAEVKLHHPSAQPVAAGGSLTRGRQNGSPSESAASHNCPTETGSSRLWTIIWTGTFVIALNICLVVVSLILYFKKVHFRKNHNIVKATSECGTGSSTGRYRWPSVLLKSKNNLGTGTSLNTHEHFFCKLNSKPNGNNGVGSHEFNWPNLSSSSSHSTISSMASPLPTTNIRINQIRPYKPSFDSYNHQSSTRSCSNNNNNSSSRNFNTGHKSVLEVNSYDINGSYSNKIDEPHLDNFQPLR